jgi:putative FmdB family regulatory protein
MLTYTYECQTCCQEWEERQRISEPPLTHCPTPGCYGVPRRLVSAAAPFVLKGKGWFKDGY